MLRTESARVAACIQESWLHQSPRGRLAPHDTQPPQETQTLQPTPLISLSLSHLSRQHSHPHGLEAKHHQRLYFCFARPRVEPFSVIFFECVKLKDRHCPSPSLPKKASPSDNARFRLVSAGAAASPRPRPEPPRPRPRPRLGALGCSCGSCY